jgi:hypothetical protein
MQANQANVGAQNAENPAAPAPPSQAYAQSAVATPADAQLQVTRESGMSGIPMTPQDVCAQRNVSLSGYAGIRRMQMVRFAVDQASVCRMQQITINGSAREAARFRRQILSQGVAEDMISTQRGSASGASVQMTFAGLATSSPQYAALFNPQYAANTSYSPATASDAGQGYAPATAPAAAPTANAATSAPAPDTAASSAATPMDSTAGAPAATTPDTNQTTTGETSTPPPPPRP